MINKTTNDASDEYLNNNSTSDPKSEMEEQNNESTYGSGLTHVTLWKQKQSWSYAVCTIISDITANLWTIMGRSQF